MDQLAQARTQNKGHPFRAVTELGELIILPARYAQEMRNERSLDFRAALMKQMHSYLPGFEAFDLLGHKSEVVQKVARKQLTQHLNSLSVPVSEECTHAENIIFGESPEWKEMMLTKPILEYIARISSRVFLGEELCRNPRWLALTVEYTVTSFSAALKLNMLPLFLRPLAAIFEPDCRRTRANTKEARQLIGGIIEKRRQQTEQAAREGLPKPVFDDTIAWAEAESGGEQYDPVAFQLMMSFAAIHTTSDLITQTLMKLAEQPQLIEPLREEMIQVLRAEGWKKTALFNLKLLDSAIKEAQRLKPASLVSMRRVAHKDVRLSDGITIRKGDFMVVDDEGMLDPEKHENPEKFDIYRFRNMREQAGSEAKAQLVSTHPDHLAFGHGYHACPGRFFAANEIKIALCHLLLKYDWKLAPGYKPKTSVGGTNLAVDPDLRVLYRRRQEEINLEDLAAMSVPGRQ
ncbi:Dihydromonacolin L monooxygenase LovA 1 [Paramyrothecium foliicola]|nr:Dihydromonacolin L monooxygenase LovA 1 [Paramyrothecium foliicola]